MKVVVLVRQRPSEKESYVDTFEVLKEGIDVKQALRNACEEFLRTKEGRQAIEDTNWDFNWGDFVQETPNEILEKHGLRHISHATETVTVDQDEVLIPSDLY